MFCFACGMLITQYSWNGYLFFYQDKGREPTAVPRQFDLTFVRQGKLGTQARQIILDNLKLEQHEDKSWKIEVPNFVTKDKFGYRELICEKYNRVALEFKAEGVATSGNRPSFLVEGPCQYSGEPMSKYLEAFEIPGTVFEREKAEDFNLLVGQANQFWVSFTDMPNFWPEEWVLSSVRFFQSDKSEEDLKWSGPFSQKLMWPVATKTVEDKRTPASKK